MSRERENDKRIVIIQPKKNIKEMLNEYGYPFKSKEHSQRVKEWQRGGRGDYLYKYINGEKFISCPEKLKYQFEPSFNMKISDLCCYKMKKEPVNKWAKKNNKNICVTGMRNTEGGNRRTLNCVALTKDKTLKKFHPLLVVSNSFENWFIEKYNINLCELYYPPFNFERTGCKGCPFNNSLQDTLETLAILLPTEKKQCEMIWKPVYDEYRRIKYRLNDEQPLLF